MDAMALREALGNVTSEALSHLNPVRIRPVCAFLLEALLLTPLAPLPGSLSSSSPTADATENNALTLFLSICCIMRECPANSWHCWVLTIVFIKMGHYWSQILFLETRIKKFTKREVLEQNKPKHTGLKGTLF